MSRLGGWLRSVFGRRRLDREMREEMEAHLDRATERLVARGLSPEEAKRQARREFGNVDYIQEMGREEWGSRWVDSTVGDLRFGLRHFAKTPLATGTIILLLTLGIGANTALFAVAHSLLTRPAPGIPPDDAVVRLQGIIKGSEASDGEPRSMSHPELLAYAEHRDLFASVAGWDWVPAVVDPTGRGGEAIPAWATYVTDDYFEVLGVRPILGTLPRFGGQEGPPVAVIGHSLWIDHFGGDPDVLGRPITVNGVTVTVTGVAPPRFGGVDANGFDPRLWLPLEARTIVETGATPFALASPDSTFLQAVARLRPGVSPEETTPIAGTVASRWMDALAEPPSRGFWDTEVVPLRANNAQPARLDPLLAAMSSGIPLLLLLITCTNVSALFVGLAARRRHEIAVRLSLGASRARLLRHLITESVMLTTLGGGLALGTVWALVGAFGTRVPGVEIVMEWPAFAFTFGLAAATGILFGLAPALHATRLGTAEVLKDAAASVTASRSRLQRGFVVAQIALAQPLLVGAGVCVLVVGRSALGRPEATLHDRILSASFWPSAVRSSEAWQGEVEAFRKRLEAHPEVVAAVVARSNAYSIHSLTVHPGDRVPGASLETFRGRAAFAGPGYFELMGIPFVRGRDFLPTERGGPLFNAGGRPVVIGSDLARDLWGEADPLGRRFRDGRAAGGAGASDVWEVVGVVDESVAGASEGVNDFRIYHPNGGASGLLVRTRGPAESFIPTFRSLAQSEWPDAPVWAETLAAEAAAERRVIAQVGGAAVAVAVLALLLSAIGLYAVIAFAVAQRKREVGVRRALGADGSGVVRLFLVRGLGMSALGLVVGLPLSMVALHLIASRSGLLGISVPVLTAATATLVLAVASLATWLPARRAAGIDPLIALRAE